MNETTEYHPLPHQLDLGGRKTSCMACQQKTVLTVFACRTREPVRIQSSATLLNNYLLLTLL